MVESVIPTKEVSPFSPQTRPDVEYSEMILYEVQLMLEAKRTEEAMKHLREYETYIADTLMSLETKGGQAIL